MSNLIVLRAQKEESKARAAQLAFVNMSNRLIGFAEELGEECNGEHARMAYHFGEMSRQFEKVANFWERVAARGATPSRLPYLQFTVDGEVSEENKS